MTVKRHFYSLIPVCLPGIPHISPGRWRLPFGPRISFFIFRPRVVGTKTKKLPRMTHSRMTSSLLRIPKVPGYIPQSSQFSYDGRRRCSFSRN